jgi:enterobacteria phage integrase
MARHRKNALPKYVELNAHNHTYYYRHPEMPRKTSLGKDEREAIRLANALNARYRIQCEQQAARLEVVVDIGGVSFSDAFGAFVEKYIADYGLKSSTAQLLHQRQRRLSEALGQTQVPMITTQMLREAISGGSQFEQSKLKTLLLRFFRYAKSTGTYPSHLANPVDDLFVDPLPHKRRQRITLEQFHAIYAVAPQWLRWLMTLAVHLALRRIDLVNLRFDDVVGGRIVSPIRKTDTLARDIEATSVDFPIHPEARRVLVEARRSSLRLGRCPFIVHREPQRQTRRAKNAVGSGRMAHPAQVLPEYASKAFYKARDLARQQTNLFNGLDAREMPTLHEIRALSSHLYAKAGYQVAAVQELMAHTDPDMTRAYQKGHARKVLRVDMMLPFGVLDDEGGVREERPVYRLDRPKSRQEIFPENFLTKNPLAA